MGKVNIRTGMKKEREGCVQPMGKPVPGDGLHLKTGNWSCFQLLGAAVGPCLSFPPC